MEITSKAALIDNDFICHLAQSNINKNDLCVVFEKIMNELNKDAVMHIMVKEKELEISKFAIPSGIIDVLFSDKYISVIDFDDILNNDTNKKAYYEMLIQDFFSLLNPNQLITLNDGETILTYWKSGVSLGEIHSLATCFLHKCSIFLSDDSDSKKIADYIDQKYMEEINVLNREELVELSSVKNNLNRKIRRSILHKSN